MAQHGAHEKKVSKSGMHEMAGGRMMGDAAMKKHESAKTKGKKGKK